jgi:hypothetical protein
MKPKIEDTKLNTKYKTKRFRSHTLAQVVHARLHDLDVEGRAPGHQPLPRLLHLLVEGEGLRLRLKGETALGFFALLGKLGE